MEKVKILEGIKGKRLAIVGGRNFSNDELLANELEDIKTKVGLVVSGGAPGADRFGELWADKNKIPKLIFPADWDKNGKAAGFIRNVHIVENCDICIAFWDGKSKGTAHTIKLCERYGKPVRVIYYDEMVL